MASAPTFAATPRHARSQVAAANTNRDGTGTLVDLITGGTNGTRIEHIDGIAQTTTAAGVIRLFIYDGSNSRLWKEIPISAVTVSGTVQGYAWTINCSLTSSFLFLPSGWKLQFTCHNASETHMLSALGGDY